MRNIISKEDLSSLNNLLTQISRKDLESKIKKFQSENAKNATDSAIGAQSNECFLFFYFVVEWIFFIIYKLLKRYESVID